MQIWEFAQEIFSGCGKAYFFKRSLMASGTTSMYQGTANIHLKEKASASI
jgi:hypothetical protein